MHANGMQAVTDQGAATRLSRAFQGTGGGEAELGEFDAAWFERVWAALYARWGFHPRAANVNVNSGNFDRGVSQEDLARFQSFVQRARQRGLATLAPVVTPNGGHEPLAWGDPFWRLARQMALYGHGIALDTPPAYALGRGNRYVAFVEQEIRWGVSAGLRTTVILSPHFDGPEFLANTQAFVRRLAGDGALPTEWVVENYDHGRLGEASGEGNPVGSESEPNSVAGVALWVARNAPTSPSGACGPGGFGAR